MNNTLGFRLLALAAGLILAGCTDPGGGRAGVYDQVYYCVFADENCVPGNDPVTLEAAQIDELVDQVLTDDENFIGFTDSTGTTLQLIVVQADQVWAEIPLPEKRGSVGSVLSKAAARELILELRAPFQDYEAELGMEFKAW